MGASRSYQCLSCRFKDLSLAAPKIARRQFHATTPKPARKSAFPNVKADKLGLTEPAVEHSYARVRPYTEREKKLLAMKYTPDQMEAIEVGEASIGDEDLRIQGRPRTDPMRISYFDDFSKVRPMIDFPVEAGQEEDVESLLRTAPTRAPEEDRTRQQEVEDMDPRMLRLSQQTGMTSKEILRLRVKNLVTHRVVNQTRMGKIQSLYFLTIAGNENGMVGIGEGKAAEDEDGRRQAMMNAIRNMRPVPRYEDRTIYGDVQAKVGASVVQLSARSPGMSFENTREMVSCTNIHSRLRQPLPTSHLRACTCSWHFRSRRPHTPLKKQDERRESCIRSAHVAASARGSGKGTRQEDGRRQEGLLRWQSLLRNDKRESRPVIYVTLATFGGAFE
jgi:small subunit ribosomal protein S5